MSKLEDILNCCFTVAVGHTYTEVNGVKNNPKSLLVVVNKKQDVGLPQKQIITIDEIPDRLMGRRCPIVIDHFALKLLVHSMRQEFEKDYIKVSEAVRIVDMCWEKYDYRDGVDSFVSELKKSLKIK